MIHHQYHGDEPCVHCANAALRAEVERLTAWHTAVDEALVCWEMVASEDARESVNRLCLAERQYSEWIKAGRRGYANQNTSAGEEPK